MRKPVLDGWRVFTDTIWKSGGGILHEKSGRFFLGTKKIRAMGKFMLKAADWLDHQESVKKKRGM